MKWLSHKTGWTTWYWFLLCTGSRTPVLNPAPSPPHSPLPPSNKTKQQWHHNKDITAAKKRNPKNDNWWIRQVDRTPVVWWPSDLYDQTALSFTKHRKLEVIGLKQKQCRGCPKRRSACLIKMNSVALFIITVVKVWHLSFKATSIVTLCRHRLNNSWYFCFWFAQTQSVICSLCLY